MNRARFVCKTAFLLVAAVVCTALTAEQSVELGDYTVHYSVVPSTFLQPDIAERYGIVRARNRAVVSIAAIHDDGIPAPEKISGSVTNLLSQESELEFKLIEEASARYYVASFLFTSEEPLDFVIRLHLDNGPETFSFKKTVYAE